MENQILDILKLHKTSDKDPKSLILASGKNLNKEIYKIIKKLRKIHTVTEITNKIAKNNNINIRCKNNNLNIGKHIIKCLKLRNMNKKQIAKLIKTSGGDINALLMDKHIPSCKKLKRIEKHLGQLKNIKIKCNKDNFCLKNLILINKSISNNTKELPLFVIKDVLYLWKSTFNIKEDTFENKKYNIIKTIDYLRCNQLYSEKTKCCKILNEELAKIMGSFCADGSLNSTYTLIWEEEHLSNLEALAKWIKLCFRKVNIKPEWRGHNSYILRFRSKIVSRYITEFFNINPGIKMYTIRIPKVVRNGPFNIRKAFVIGTMTFEAGANNGGNVSLGVCSKKFRDDIAKILKEDKLQINEYVTQKESFKTPMYSIATNNNLDIKQKRKFKSYFEKDTFKWLKMKEFANGFPQKIRNPQEAINNLRIFFYKNNKVNIERIITNCIYLKNFNIYDLVKETKYPRGTLTKYLSFLCKTNMLIKNRSKVSDYIYNKNISKWRLPTIKYHKTLKI